MTRRWSIHEAPDATQLAEIAGALEEGAVLLLPTDTIYGLHCAARNDRAVARIAAIKGRDETKPFIVLAASVDDLPLLGVDASSELLARLGSLWPAPLTVILPLKEPIAASRGLTSLAIRIPALDWLRALVSRSGPLVSTSANRSGEPAVDAPGKLADDLQLSLDGIVDGGLRHGEPSAILDLSGGEPKFIREREPSFTQKVWKTLWKTL